jgi:hypothetical protein
MTDTVISKTTLKARKCISQLKVQIKITGVKKAQLRIKLSTYIFRFAAFIAGMQSKIDIEIKNEED